MPGELLLNCWIDGDETWQVFDVNIGTTNVDKVTTLKRLVAAQASNAFGHLAPRQLDLWKVNLPLLVKRDFEKATAEIDWDTDPLNPASQMSDIFKSRPREGFAHIAVRGPKGVSDTVAGTKRRFDGAFPRIVDPSDEICTKLIQPFDDIPKCARDVVSLIKSPLLQKLPVNLFMFQCISSKHPYTAELLQPATGEMEMIISYALSDFNGQQAMSASSEDMLHSSVDALLRHPLKAMSVRLGSGKMPIAMDRNRTNEESSAVTNRRPDFLLWLNDILLFWGEERAVSGAEKDLDKDFRMINPVVSGDVNFMICYAVNGRRIRFYATDSDQRKSPTPFLPLTHELDISNFLCRFTVLETVINIARIMMTIRDDLPAVTYPLGKRMMSGHSEITYNFDGVVKKLLVAHLPYCEPDVESRVKFLCDMYKHTKGHRGLVQVRSDPRLTESGTHYVVEMTTMGARQLPESEEELRVMVKDLVTGLDWLHKGGYLHRDIRNQNVVYDRALKQYVLIDFEHSGKQEGRRSQRRNPAATSFDGEDWLRDWDYGTLDDGVYTKASDMYQLGRFLHDWFRRMIDSEDGKAFVARLTGKKMTAEEALLHEWIRTVP
ncbi:hypothetical protein BD410DRAFT_797247 [Rickenella mellea]|uniref:Protein kinase domain-containing protein n=1 Tax=Rickenella mellea TaxID=50990 RepID=A0A4Y7PHL9_9AGAM|nr:hypothetical protein BD410DRAFT_797247 [Rickenella mellea]